MNKVRNYKICIFSLLFTFLIFPINSGLSAQETLHQVASKNNIDLSKFYDTRKKACDLVVQLAKIQKMYDDFQNIKENGYLFVDNYVKKKISKKIMTHRYRRTTQKWTKVSYVPGENNPIQFNVRFKFSSNKEKTIVPLPTSGRNKSSARCIPIAGRPNFCFEILETSETKVKMKFWVRAETRLKGKKWQFDIPNGGVTVTAPAPFGYLDDLAQMKESKKQQALKNLKGKVLDLVKVDKEKIEKIEKMAKANQSEADVQKLLTEYVKEVGTKTLESSKYSKLIKIPQKLYDLNRKINKTTSTVYASKQKIIDFKNADAMTKVNMRCSSDLPVIKALGRG